MNDSKHANPDSPLVVGIGGTTRTPSSTDRALRLALKAAEEAGARVHCFSGPFLVRLPHFAPEHQTRTEEQRQLVEMVRQADGLIVASPGYHGGVSGLVKTRSICWRICVATRAVTWTEEPWVAWSPPPGGKPR